MTSGYARPADRRPQPAQRRGEFLHGRGGSGSGSASAGSPSGLGFSGFGFSGFGFSGFGFSGFGFSGFGFSGFGFSRHFGYSEFGYRWFGFRSSGRTRGHIGMWLTGHDGFRRIRVADPRRSVAVAEARAGSCSVRLRGLVASAAGTAEMADGPTASPCVVTGKECPIDACRTTGAGMP